MILIISDAEDAQVYFVIPYLKMRHRPYFLLSVKDFPLNILYTGSWSSDNGHRAEVRTAAGESVDLNTVSAVWFRKPRPPVIPSNLDPAEREHAYNECRSALLGIYNNLRNRYWISDLANIQIADNKPFQLTVARQLGLNIPTTIVTNSPATAWEFYAAHGGRVVYKTLSSGLISTRRVSWRDPRVVGYTYTTYLKDYSATDFETVANTP
jgi:hypothetical protein